MELQAIEVTDLKERNEIIGISLLSVAQRADLDKVFYIDNPDKDSDLPSVVFFKDKSGWYYTTIYQETMNTKQIDDMKSFIQKFFN